MSTYAFMKMLESAPSRYDKGIRLLSFGKLDKHYDRLVSCIRSGQRVLDIGCGTGALTIRAAHKGAVVRGIDINPQMLEIAKVRANKANLNQNIEFCEKGVAELGSEESQIYDVVMSGLCFSELSEDELKYTLAHVKCLLKPGGLLIVADEVKSNNSLKKLINWLINIPLKTVTYLLTQTSTSAVKDLPEKVKLAGLEVIKVRLNRLENFIELVAVNHM